MPISSALFPNWFMISPVSDAVFVASSATMAPSFACEATPTIAVDISFNASSILFIFVDISVVVVDKLDILALISSDDVATVPMLEEISSAALTIVAIFADICSEVEAVDVELPEISSMIAALLCVSLKQSPILLDSFMHTSSWTFSASAMSAALVVIFSTSPT